MIIRHATIDDVPALCRLFEQLGYTIALRDVIAMLAHSEAIGSRVLVAETAGKPCGAIVLHVIQPLHETGKWGLISALIVDETLRGAGTGARLLEAAHDEARAQGCTQIELSSSESRVRAHHFYDAQGYREVRKRFVKRPV
ncbi:GNAT family N-acetyltransferase [Cronobacter sakazakii]|uniref:GNAT family N-acetyltransferase n=1 Tax=Cronobacter sakazakii TaxID=28141 RepID=UPI000CFC46E3|nr:GNAT family N-acetyltransferase [Cronobacter sakazakii]